MAEMSLAQMSLAKMSLSQMSLAQKYSSQKVFGTTVRQPMRRGPKGEVSPHPKSKNLGLPPPPLKKYPITPMKRKTILKLFNPNHWQEHLTV